MQQQSTLSPGWIELKTSDGKTYYQNQMDKTTQWERPLSPPAPAFRDVSPEPDVNAETIPLTTTPPVKQIPISTSTTTIPMQSQFAAQPSAQQQERIAYEPTQKQNYVQKFFHVLYSYKAMILLYVAFWTDLQSMVESMVDEGGLSKELSSDEADDLHNVYFYCISEPVLLKAQCPEDYRTNPLYLLLIVIYAVSTLISAVLLWYIYWTAPNYGGLTYYAHLVMFKRCKMFKRYMYHLYAMIGVAMLLWVLGMGVAMAMGAEQFGTSFIGNMFITLFIEGTAVMELRTTNEINFKYEYPTDIDEIRLKPQKLHCGLSLITAEDMFERLEEAVMVYSIQKETYLLAQILLNANDREYEKVYRYYQYIFTQKQPQKSSVAPAPPEATR